MKKLKKVLLPPPLSRLVSGWRGARRVKYYLALYKPVGNSDVEFPIIIEKGIYRLTSQPLYATRLHWFTAMLHYLRFRSYSDRAKLKLFRYRKTFGRLEIKKLATKQTA